jgi:hypothetical protein
MPHAGYHELVLYAAIEKRAEQTSASQPERYRRIWLWKGLGVGKSGVGESGKGRGNDWMRGR